MAVIVVAVSGIVTAVVLINKKRKKARRIQRKDTDYYAQMVKKSTGRDVEYQEKL